MTENSNPYKRELPRRVRLIAPRDLNGGYEFPVRLGNRATFLVAVPAQGVRREENFIANVIQDGTYDDREDEDVFVVTEEMATAADPHHVPHGRFRDGLCACSKYGICHPPCFLGCFCPATILGQVLTRLKLNHWGSPLPPNTNSKWTTFQVVLVIALYFTISDIFLQTLKSNYGPENTKDSETPFDSRRDGWVDAINVLTILISVMYAAYIIFLACKARQRTRRIYNIPAKCGGCSDFCCACCCWCCTVCHLAHHTADYKEYEARYCTDTGLGRGAPEILL